MYPAGGSIPGAEMREMSISSTELEKAGHFLSIMNKTDTNSMGLIQTPRVVHMM